MQIQNHSMKYYLFSLSNFLAAIGGGIILGKGVGVIDVPFLQGSSLLAFFVGTVFGLFLLQLTPKKFSQIMARWFSICGGITSFILFQIFNSYAVNETLVSFPAVVAFILLCIRFGFWFYSRVLRASAAAGQQQNIAWVEFGYYAGVIIGLVLWNFLGIDIGMSAALLLDSFLQISAGLIDLFVNRKKPSMSINDSIDEKTSPILNSNYYSRPKLKQWQWRLAISVMFLTVGVQVIIFSLAHKMPHDFSSYMLAFFYFGAAASAVFCKYFNIRLKWNSPRGKQLGYATIFLGRENNEKQISFLLGSILSAISVGVVVLCVLYWPQDHATNFLLNFEKFFLLTFIFISTFTYGILELAILDRIGLEEKHSSHKGMILQTYGIMSIAAALSLWVLDLTQSALWGISITLFFCFLATILVIKNREVMEY